MGSIKEIRNRIKSVESTLKITNAMYLISSSGLRKARKQLSNVSPYFKELSYTISDILHHSPNIEHPYFDLRPQIEPDDRKVALVLISADRGLAGSYNHNVIRLAEQQLETIKNPQLFLIGQMGRNFFSNESVPINEECLYTSQNPTLSQARSISSLLLSLYLQEDIDEIRIVYTKMINPLLLEPNVVTVLPLNRKFFPWQPRYKAVYPRVVSYIPSEHDVLNRLVPSYLSGMLYGSMIESFCSEQSARMTAMDASTKNAREMLKNLTLMYNRARQAAITQEINEVIGGSKANISS